MSIWVSVGRGARALDGHDDDANYRAEGEPTINVDLATTGHHDHIRLGVWSDDNRIDVCALLSPEQAVRLRDDLVDILGPDK